MLIPKPARPQKLLQELWQRPYVSTVVPAQHTQMLWNAMNDANVDMHSSMARGRSSSWSGGGDSDSSSDDNVDSGSESYTKYDTDSSRWVLLGRGASSLSPMPFGGPFLDVPD